MNVFIKWLDYLFKVICAVLLVFFISCVWREGLDLVSAIGIVSCLHVLTD